MLTTTLNMKKFGFEKSQIRNIIHDSFEKYNISEENKKKVNSFIEEQIK